MRRLREDDNNLELIKWSVWSLMMKNEDYSSQYLCDN